MPQWGIVRATYDVDIKVLVPDTDYTAARAALRAAFPAPAREHAPDNPLIVAVAIDDVIANFLLALPGYEELIGGRPDHSEGRRWARQRLARCRGIVDRTAR